MISTRIFLTLGFFYSFSLFAHTLKVIGPCDEKPLFEGTDTETSPGTNLGDFTVTLFNRNHVPFSGGSEGIESIYDSPKGKDALEILSNTQMRAYGWCVTINGEQPDQMPNQVVLPEKSAVIEWFYAYSLYDNGVWKDYCTPSWQVKSRQICLQK